MLWEVQRKVTLLKRKVSVREKFNIPVVIFGKLKNQETVFLFNQNYSAKSNFSFLILIAAVYQMGIVELMKFSI